MELYTGWLALKATIIPPICLMAFLIHQTLLNLPFKWTRQAATKMFQTLAGKLFIIGQMNVYAHCR